MFRISAIIIPLFVLAACGGGGGGAPAPAPATDIRTLTNSQPPAETVADQASRLAGIVARTDSMFASTWFGESSSPELPTFRARSSCSGTSCTFYEPQTGISITQSLDDQDLDTSMSKAILSKHGITTLDTREGASRSYASVMDHSAFSVLSERFSFEGTTVWSRLSLAGGDLTRSTPASSATWRGIMVGVPTGVAGRTTFLQGDAAVTYRFSGSLDASFTNIKDITNRRNYSVPSVRFNGIPVGSNGTFQAGGTGNLIRGGFYGPRHAETTGVFEQSGIVGSFGAKRQ